MPTVDFVKSVDLRHVRVQYSAAVDPEGLLAAPYLFSALSVPAYNPTVTSARYVNGKGVVLDSLVELYLDNDLSPGVEYQLDISPFTGVSGTQATFTSFVPNWPPTRSMDLWDYIPSINKAEDTSEHLERFILCIQDQLDTTLSSVDNWANILDYERAPEAFLDLMLRDLGNPFAFESLTEADKRALAGVLVQIYKLKGTDLAIEAAVRFFLGFESQINLFRDSGSRLSDLITPIDLLDDSFVLGGGGPFDFTLTVATTEPPGRALTELEVSRIQKIVAVVKPAMARFIPPIFYGLAAPTRVQITGSGASVTITWLLPADEPDTWRVYLRLNDPGVTPFTSARYDSVSGATDTITISTPVGTDPGGSTYHFSVVPVLGATEGMVSEVEVRNNLGPPSFVTPSSGNRSVTLVWAGVVGATSYKIYKRLTSPATPVTADFVFHVLDGATTYLDTEMLPGQTAYYSVVPLTGDSEGFYSTSVSGTAL